MFPPYYRDITHSQCFLTAYHAVMKGAGSLDSPLLVSRESCVHGCVRKQLYLAIGRG